MKNSIYLRVVAMALSVTLIFGAFGITSLANDEYPLKGADSTSPTLEEMQSLLSTSTYEAYVRSHSDSLNNPDRSDIELGWSVVSGDAVRVSESKEVQASMIKSPANWTSMTEEQMENSVFLPSVNADGKAGSATWYFNIPEGKAGFYTIEINYFDCIIDAELDADGNAITTKSSVSAIERKLKIRDTIPFDEVSSIAFDKHWKYDYTTTTEPVEVPVEKLPFVSVGSVSEYAHVADGENSGYYKYVTDTYEENGKLMQTVTTYKITQDINGNSMAPAAAAISQWSVYTCKDSSGYNDGALKFYLSEGEQWITLEAIREPVIISTITLKACEAPSADGEGSGVKSYDQYVADITAEYGDKAKPAGGAGTVIEAEFPDLISDSSVAATNDNTSAITYPISSKAQIYNVIGENSYDAMGQWAAYTFTVSETGFYKFGARYKQKRRS